MSQSDTYDYDVLVVGAGPSGLTTAAALARFGVRVLVIEKHPGLSIFPKAIGVRPRSMEIFRGWGLEPEVRLRSQHARTEMSVQPVLGGPRQVVGLGLPAGEALAAVSPVTMALCGQDQLEAILHDHVLAHGGEVRFRTELLDFTETADGVAAEIRSRDSGERSTVAARYLIGADGGRSLVRSLTGIEFDVLASEGDHLAVLFNGDLSAVMAEPPYVLNITVAPGVEGLFASTALPQRWLYDMEWHPEAGERLEDWTPERLTARIRAAAGLPEFDPEILGIFPWDFGANVAKAYRRGRVLLVGDAAHRTTPRGATGMNTGIADGHNLGWKLAGVINGWAAPTLLDSYESEREPVGRHNASASLVTMISRPPGDGLAHDFGVSYASGAIVGGTPLAGQRAPHASVEPLSKGEAPGAPSEVPGALSSSKGEISTLDLFDGHFTLIIGRRGAAWRATAYELAGAGVPISVVGVDAEVSDPRGELADRYQLTEEGCVLVRPDGFVTWGHDGFDGDRLRDAVRLATGHRVGELVG